MKSVTYGTGIEVHYIDVEGTGAARRPSTPGSVANLIQLTPFAQNLDLIAGLLTVNGAAGSYNTLAAYDQKQAKRQDFIAVGPGSLSRDSVESTGIGPAGVIFHVANVAFSNLAALSIAAPGANLALTTSPITNVFLATATLDALPSDPNRSRIEDPESPAIDFNDDLASLVITEGAYGATLVVDKTPLPCTTTVNLGPGGVVDVDATSGPLNILGNPTIPGVANIGQGGLARINGDVSIVDPTNNGALVTINVDDSEDRKAHNDVTISALQITGLAGVDETTVIGYVGNMAGRR